MLSEFKRCLRVAEVVTDASVVLAITLAASALIHPTADFSHAPTLNALFVVMFATFGTACVLVGDFARATRASMSDGLSMAEVRALVRWAPHWQKVGAMVGVAIVVCSAFVFDDLEWNFGEPIGSGTAGGFALCVCAFNLFALPVIGSAVRMQGGYVAADTTHDATR